MRFLSKGLKNEFETAVLNEPSGLQPVNFYCSLRNVEFLFVCQFVTRHRADVCPLSSKMQRMMKTVHVQLIIVNSILFV